MGKSFFTNKYTNTAKGIAILVLLFHHLGLNQELNIFKDSPLLTNIAEQGKVCVSIFLILSGYGLNCSINKKNINDIKGMIKFTGLHLIKMMKDYWYIFIIFISWGKLAGYKSLGLYGNGSEKLKHLIIDFLGLADFCHTPTYNETWWFMSLIIILYIIFPIFKIILNRSAIALLLILIIFKWFQIFNIYAMFNYYAFLFGLGMVFSEFNLFDKIRNLNKTKLDEIIITIAFLIVGVMTRSEFEGQSIFDVLAACSIIFASNNILANVKIVNNIFEFLGKNSSNMFMMHTFIYKYFFNDLFRQLKYPLVMYIVLVLAALTLSILINKSKNVFKKVIERFIIIFSIIL